LHQGGADLESLRRELDQARTEREQTWRESVQLRRNEEQLSTEAVQLRSKVSKLQDKTEQEHTDFTRCKEELERCKIGNEKVLEAMKLKDDEISFLRAHISQLTQSISQLALKPGDEEIKKKGWWRFWK
jgi:chromosome segregation ATPase